MVWILRAVDASTVPSTYYLKSAATYSVGRKDCYITIQTDKTISRVHANIITEEAQASDRDVQEISDIPRMLLKVKDLSKFGTFVNKEPGSKPLISIPSCEAALKEGDQVTFGTNKTAFRVEYLSLLLCISSSQEDVEDSTRSALRHGAYVVDTWKEGCTHLLVEEGSLVTEMVIAAVASNKPVLQIDWWQRFSTENGVITELLPYSRPYMEQRYTLNVGDSILFAPHKLGMISFRPTLVYQGRESTTSIKIALPLTRRGCLLGYTFYIGPLHLYEHGNYLVRLLEAAGGTVELISKKSQNKQAGMGARQVLVVKPKDGTVKDGWASAKLTDGVAHLPHTSEEKIVVGLLMGQVDVTTLPLPASPVASGDSDETRDEPDNEEHDDTAETHTSKKIVRQPTGASIHVPIDLEDVEPVLKLTGTKRHCVQEEPTNQHEGNSLEVVAATSGKRQKVQSESLPMKTPQQLSSQQNGPYTICNKEQTGATDLEIPKEPTTQRYGNANERKKLLEQTVVAGTIKALFSQQEGKRRKVEDEGLEPNRGKGLTSHSQLPFVSSSRREIGSQAVPEVGDSTIKTEHLNEGLHQAVMADIIYSKLIVRKEENVPFPTTPTLVSVLNFKCFRRKGVEVSGNSFATLVPFAKEPYREADFGREQNEFMQEERKRKEAEIMADDLFSAERLNRQLAAKPKPRAPARK